MNKLEQDVQNDILNYFHKYEDDEYYSLKATVYWGINLKDKLTSEFIEWCDCFGNISIEIDTGFPNVVCLRYTRTYKDFASIDSEDENE